MAHNVSNEYKQVIYSGDARNQLKILFNGVELQNADRYCERMTVKSRIVPNGAKIFNLNNFISKEVEIIFHDIDTSIIQDQVSISIGTLVGNSYEYVPIGIFNIQDTPTNDKNKTTIKLRDNSVKFDFNYNAQDLIEASNGRATKLQILQDICTQAGVTCNITSFIGYLDEIGVYDNTITARQYIANIAEQAGKIATINRSGELIFVDLNNLTTWEIPIDIVEKYENGTTYKIGKVVYEDGIVRYETDDSNDDTLFLDGSNNYINGELIKEQASSTDNTYYLQNTGDSELAKLEIEGKTTQETRSGINKLKMLEMVSTTTNGLTYKVENEVFYINGTHTAGANLSTIEFEDFTLPAGTYYFYVLRKGTSRIDISMRGINGVVVSSTNFGNVFQNTLTNRQFTLSEETTFTRFAFYVPNGITFNNDELRIMVCNASHTASEYEKYGAMPSPDYPSELVSVGYENLYQGGDTLTTNGVTFSKNSDGSYNIVGTATAQANNYNFVDIADTKLENGEYYTFYVNQILPAGVEILAEAYNGNTWLRHITDVLINTRPTYTRIANITNATRIRFGLRVTNGKTANITNLKVMLVKGVKQYGFVPFDKYGIEVRATSKNLLLNNGITQTINGVTFTKNENKSITISGTATTNTDYYFVGESGIYEKLYLPSGNYNLSGVTSGSGSTYMLYAVRNRNGSLGYFQSLNSGGIIIDIQENDTFRIFIRVMSGQSPNITIYPQLEKGTIATTYEPYNPNSQTYILDNPLRAIGNYKDKLYIENGMLYVDRKIGSVVLNGSENWRDFFSTPGIIVVNLLNCVNSPSTINCMSNYFANTYSRAYIRTHLDSVDKVCATNGEELILANKNITSVNDFKTWLSTHNTKVDYLLAEPYTEELGEIELPTTYENSTSVAIYSNINTNTYLQYRKDKAQLEAILDEVDEFDINSLKTGKILGNPAIDPYDLIQIHDVSKNLYKGVTPATTNGIEVVENNDGSYNINGTATAQANFYGYYNLNEIGLINNETYTLSVNMTLPGYIYIMLEGYNGNTWVRNLLSPASSGGSVRTGTINLSNVNRIRFGIRCENGKSFEINNLKIQLEKSNVATDYVPYKNETYTTLATNDLTYTGVLINTFDTQIGEEAKEQNVFINGEETFKKWARTTIDNIEGSITLQAGQIDEANGKINQTNLTIDSQGALLNVIANNSNIDIAYDENNNPVSGEVREVTTTTGFTFNAEGMTIEDSQSNFKALHRNTGTYYQDGTTIVGQYTKDGSKQKDLDLFGVYTYGKNDINETPMFIAQLFTDGNGEECFGHFYNRGD